MIQVRHTLTVLCDWRDRRYGCTAAESVHGDPEAETPEHFAARAVAEFTDQGWQCSHGPTLCPAHNTAANRRRTFAAVRRVK